MRSSVSTLHFCTHVRFGVGCILGDRETDSGLVRDIWFLDGKVRAILPAHLEDAAAELTKDQRKELRHAMSVYRKAHKKKPNARIELSFSRLTNRRNATAHTEWDYETYETASAITKQEEQDPPDSDVEKELDSITTEINVNEQY